ncbi:SDR family NAD(P)-dependent oxidoreductase [Sandarakinorhabdus sp.]|uniref:SDR family NAD(P)-dependent oxidoreductase n=1 Tax=Sandarakinorhabdus sp. TaxID=1916663 RepID=UPI00286DA234|nr:SDR family NAD(P)-dependent oxidoreductase [Sandarakinorhabdus sp.]
MSDVAGKTIWITGASSGIGKGLALALAAKGARLVLSGRNRAALDDVAAHCPGSIVEAFETTDLDALPSIVARVEAATGGIDWLVNNAGISQRSLALDTDFAVYRTLMEVDFFAPLRLTQLVLPAMVARRSGRIINNASVAGKVGSPLRTGYCAAKHAMVGWSDAMRAEIAQHGVQVHVLTPGFVATGIGRNALRGDGSQKGDGADPVDAGITIHEAAEQIIAGITSDVPEISVGRDGAAEMQLLGLKRQDPEACFKLMASMAPAAER